jgi:hypothetical protein
LQRFKGLQQPLLLYKNQEHKVNQDLETVGFATVPIGINIEGDCRFHGNDVAKAIR